MTTKPENNESFVRDFQTRTGLTADGWAGPSTRAKLDSLLPAKSAATGITASENAIRLMHEFEGCRLTAYPDPGSRDGTPWTIGWGSTGPGIGKDVTWTQAQADERFARDVATFSAKVRDVLGSSPVTQNQFDALVSFAYNVGVGALRDSTLLKMHKAADYRGAQAQFARWNKNDGKVMAGLTRRREAEATLYGAL